MQVINTTLIRVVENLEQTIFDYCLQRKDIGIIQYRMNI